MPASLKCLSSVDFGSFLAYSPRGSSDESQKSRQIAYAIKNVQEGAIETVVSRLREEVRPGRSAHILNDVLGPEVLVVPCPRSSPLVLGGLWPSRDICNALVHEGLAQRSSVMLERFVAVVKSSAAGLGNRPKPNDHIQSMRVVSEPEFAPQRITIVDDVITKGATLIAAATHLQYHFAKAQVRVFALVRTRSLVPDIEHVLDPMLGRVIFDGVNSDREERK